jgi:hypothetical protein
MEQTKKATNAVKMSLKRYLGERSVIPKREKVDKKERDFAVVVEPPETVPAGERPQTAKQL